MARSYELQAKERALRAGQAILVRKHKRRQEAVGPQPSLIDHFYAVAGGEVEILAEGRWIRCGERSLALFRRGARYGVRPAAGGAPPRILIATLELPRRWRPSFPRAPIAVPAAWWRRLLELEASADYDQWGQRVVPRAALLALADRIVAAVAAGAGSGPRRADTAAAWHATFAAAEQLVRDRACAGLGVEDLADALHVSPMHLRRIYRAIAGSSPKAAITAARVAEAQRLLRAGRLSVREIASAVGFATVQRFVTAFKARCGEPPGRWAEHQ